MILYKKFEDVREAGAALLDKTGRCSCRSGRRQSRRSASIGCTLAARHAGIQLAANATTINSPAPHHSVAGSDGAIPKSIDFTNRVRRNEAPTPSAIAA